MDDVWQLKDANSGELLTYQFNRQPTNCGRFLARPVRPLPHPVVPCHHLAGCRLVSAALRAGIPYGFSMHDFIACPTINCSMRGVYARRDGAGALPALPQRHRSFRHHIVAGAPRMRISLDGVIRDCPSDWAAGMFRRYFRANDIRVIPHGSSCRQQRRGMPSCCCCRRMRAQHWNTGALDRSRAPGNWSVWWRAGAERKLRCAGS